MKKSFKSVLALIVCAFLAILCGMFAGCNVDYDEVYNDDAKIISYNGNYKAMGRVKNVHSHSASVSCMSFSGVDTLYSSFEVDSGLSANLTINYTGEEGKLKVVLTDKNRVYTLKEVGMPGEDMFVGQTSGALNFEDIPDGTYKLKIVGVKAEFNLEFDFS